jgi:hypothetical protein
MPCGSFPFKDVIDASMIPVKAFRSNLRRARKFIYLYDAAIEAGKTHDASADLLRTSLVLIMASLDAYIHQVISENMVDFVKLNLRKSRNDQARRARVKTIEELIKSMFQPSDYLDMFDRARPYVQFRKRVDEVLFQRTYQSPGDIDRAFRLFAVPDFWPSLERSGLGGKLAATAAGMLQRFYERRNQIAHEMDRERSRKRKAKLRRLGRQDCQDCISLVELIVRFTERTYMFPDVPTYILK